MSRRTEEWRDIPGPGFNGIYQVSDWGRVRSFRKRGTTEKAEKPRILRPTSSKDGTKYYCVFKTGQKQHTMEVGRSVALAFLGPIPKGAIASHRDGNPKHNWLWNIAIRWQREVSRERMRKYAAGVNRKPVVKIDRGLEVIDAYSSESAAARANGFNQRSLWRYCNLKNTSVFAPDGFLYAYDDDAWMRRSLDRAMAELDALGLPYQDPGTECYYNLDPEPETNIDPAAIIWEDALPIAGGGYRIQAL